MNFSMSVICNKCNECKFAKYSETAKIYCSKRKINKNSNRRCKYWESYKPEFYYQIESILERDCTTTPEEAYLCGMEQARRQMLND